MVVVASYNYLIHTRYKQSDSDIFATGNTLKYFSRPADI